MTNGKVKCTDCEYCYCLGKSAAQGFNAYGRKHYYCNNPSRNKENDKLFNDFVGYGDNTRESPLKLKTTPKWCPKKKE